jgi:hypothetical protein
MHFSERFVDEAAELIIASDEKRYLKPAIDSDQVRGRFALAGVLSAWKAFRAEVEEYRQRFGRST